MVGGTGVVPSAVLGVLMGDAQDSHDRVVRPLPALD